MTTNTKTEDQISALRKQLQKLLWPQYGVDDDGIEDIVDLVLDWAGHRRSTSPQRLLEGAPMLEEAPIRVNTNLPAYKYLRAESISQTAVARRAGCSQATVNNTLSGMYRNAAVEQAIRELLAEAGLTLSDEEMFGVSS